MNSISKSIIQRSPLQRALNSTSKIASDVPAEAQLSVINEQINKLVDNASHLDKNYQAALKKLLARVQQDAIKSAKWKIQTKSSNVKNSLDEVEEILKASAVFFPVLVEGKVPALEVLYHFYGNQGIVANTLDHVWSQVMRMSSVVLNKVPFMPLEKEVILAKKNELDNEAWNNFALDKLEKGYALSVHNLVKRYYSKFWEVCNIVHDTNGVGIIEVLCFSSADHAAVAASIGSDQCYCQ